MSPRMVKQSHAYSYQHIWLNIPPKRIRANPFVHRTPGMKQGEKAGGRGREGMSKGKKEGRKEEGEARIATC